MQTCTNQETNLVISFPFLTGLVETGSFHSSFLTAALKSCRPREQPNIEAEVRSFARQTCARRRR